MMASPLSGPLVLEPCDDSGPFESDVAAELKRRKTSGACLAADPALRYTKALSDLGGVEELGERFAHAAASSRRPRLIARSSTHSGNTAAPSSLGSAAGRLASWTIDGL